MNRNQALRSILLGGVLPVVAFTLIEQKFGVLWGLVAGMAFGLGEIVYEYTSNRKVSAITWLGNGMLIGLGGLSLLTQEGIWFKLQPAILEAGFACLLIGSVVLKRPLLVLMAEKQGILAKLPEPARPFLLAKFTGLTFRLGLFFIAHAGLAGWAAFYWSTAAWAWLKGLGFTVSLIFYFAGEMWWLRRR